MASLLQRKHSNLRENFGEDHAFVPGSYENLASVYNKIGRHDEAEELCEKARIIWEKIFGEDNVRVAVLPFWHQCTRRSENTFKPKNLTRKH